jgi:ferredoxin-NADP reductase
MTRKIRRFDLVLSFFAAAAVSIIVTSLPNSPLTSIEGAMLHAPLFFFAFVMLTEPLTTPPTRADRIAYGALVGFAFAPAVHIGSVYSTPELALLLGNVFSYFLGPKSKYALKLKEKQTVGGGIYDFIFSPNAPMKFQPGQYMEWTLAHKKSDSRGNRRYFTVASSPSERDIRLGVRFNDNGSSFKRRMLAMQPGDEIIGGQLAGDFTLPHNAKNKLVFIAGGIGITPFRSMIKAMSDRGEKRNVVLLYSNRTADEIAYRDVFDEAAKTIGLKTVYSLTGAASPPSISNNDYPISSCHFGRIDDNLIKREISDYRERTFYVSGTQSLVDGTTKLLRTIGIPRSQIKTDFFPGF